MASHGALIIGAGKIGAFFDRPGSGAVLTHAHALSSHPGFRLLGFSDADHSQAERAAALWGGKAFPSLGAALAGGADLAVLAVPDDLHYPLLKELADYPVRAVLAEKPLTRTLEEAREIVSLYRERGIALVVNYSRRFVPEFASLRGRIASGDFGRFLAGTGYYGKGTLHNGSHMIDLLRLLLGEVTVRRRLDSVADCFPEDPSCSALLSFKDGATFLLQAVDCRLFTIFEADFLFERARVRMVDSGFGIEIYRPRESEIFAGYFNLQETESTRTSLGTALAHCAESLYRILSAGDVPPCSGSDALAAQQVCLEIREGTS